MTEKTRLKSQLFNKQPLNGTSHHAGEYNRLRKALQKEQGRTFVITTSKHIPGQHPHKNLLNPLTGNEKLQTSLVINGYGDINPETAAQNNKTSINTEAHTTQLKKKTSNGSSYIPTSNPSPSYLEQKDSNLMQEEEKVQVDDTTSTKTHLDTVPSSDKQQEEQTVIEKTKENSQENKITPDESSQTLAENITPVQDTTHNAKDDAKDNTQPSPTSTEETPPRQLAEEKNEGSEQTSEIDATLENEHHVKETPPTYTGLPIDLTGIEQDTMGPIGHFIMKKAGWFTMPVCFRDTTDHNTPCILTGLSRQIDEEKLTALRSEGWTIAPTHAALVWDFTDDFIARDLKQDFRTLWTNSFKGNIDTQSAPLKNAQRIPGTLEGTTEIPQEIIVTVTDEKGTIAKGRILQGDALEWLDDLSFTPPADPDTKKKRSGTGENISNHPAWRALMANTLRTARDRKLYVFTGKDFAQEKLARGATWDTHWIAVKNTSIWSKLATAYLKLRIRANNRKRAKLFDKHSPFAGDEE